MSLHAEDEYRKIIASLEFSILRPGLSLVPHTQNTAPLSLVTTVTSYTALQPQLSKITAKFATSGAGCDMCSGSGAGAGTEVRFQAIRKMDGQGEERLGNKI